VSARTIVALDIETTSLRHDRQAWEVAMIRRDPCGREESVTMMLKVDVTKADPKALEIGGYYERYAWPLANRITAASQIERWTRGATIVGAAPSFDCETLGKFLIENGYLPAWHHRLRCVTSLVAGMSRGACNGSLAESAAYVGIDVADYALHTALADAQLALDVYDRVMTNGGAA
jgi:hypothetical protein